MLLPKRPGSHAVFLAILVSCLVGCQRQQSSSGPAPSAATPPQTPQPPKASGPPAVPDGFVLRPTFETTRGKISAGTAFTVQLPEQSRPLLLTAIHLLGPAGGLPEDVPAGQVPQVVKRVTLTDCFESSRKLGTTSEAIVIPEAKPLGTPSKAGDILAFWAPEGSTVHPLRLAAATPARGERVWLAASVRQGAPATQRLHPATVTEVDENGDILYQFDNEKLTIRATSGAPVLNAAGEVVAINLGGGSAGKAMFGVGNPVGRFGPQLKAALERASRRP